ncbi:metallophosphoesterase [Olivibacter sp. XZL3]|uniref:metallophosphoesterase family protein n=1 Tax=Olivibacter sp. XZL3 TaxID=1735116 RepID=UPI0010663F7D|nr:metallophosphoesterase [Olivibacter sp. XZL3]
MAKKAKTTVAALADIHIRMSDKGRWADCFEEISSKADVLLICGDLTDTGDEDEAAVLAGELKSCSIPVIGVLGNHDYEKGRQKLIRQILQESNMTILDGEGIVIDDIGFAGVKGFGGGFDEYMLSMFGEDSMKAFVQEAVNESLQLDRALARLEQDNPDILKIALLHYSPIKETVLGEPEQIFPFLGSSRLADPLHRRKVYAAFHGHAHAGQLDGVTSGGVKVFNVALPILKKENPRSSFYLLDIQQK